MKYHSMPGTSRHVTMFTVTPLAVMTNEKLQELSHELEHEEYSARRAKPAKTSPHSNAKLPKNTA